MDATGAMSLRSRFADTAGLSRGVIGRIVFGAKCGAPVIENGVPTLALAMGDGPFMEEWKTSGKTSTGCFGSLVYAHDDAVLFCAGFIPARDRYADSARRVYADAFALITQLKFPKLFRMWNFIPRINEDNGEGLEVYRDFCRGRAIAFEEDYALANGMPAATGIGTSGEGVGFYFLACRDGEHAVKHIENSRQIPAYRYPLQYGPKSPSFARGTLLSNGSNEHAALFVSGTASILGHETVHAGDLAKQWDVATTNIAHLIGADNLASQGIEEGFTLRDLDQIKVYYRHASDLAAVRQLAQTTFDARADVRFLEADICRADLLVEIEGIAMHRDE